MNPLHELIIVASVIILIYSLVVILLVNSNSNLKKTTSDEYNKLKKLYSEAIFKHKNYESDKLTLIKKHNEIENTYLTLKDLYNKTVQEKQSALNLVKFKDDLIYGYKEDLKKIVGLEDDNLKLKEAIEHLELLLCEKNVFLEAFEKDCTLLKEANEAWKLKYNRVRYEKAESYKKMKQKIFESFLKLKSDFEKMSEIAKDNIEKNKALNELVDECAIYIMNNCK